MKQIDNETQITNTKLVQSVRRHRALYDTSCHEYALKQHTENAWESVAEETKTSVKDCKLRWRNLRISYLRYLRMMNTPGKAVKPYYLLKDMSFMERHVKTQDMSKRTVEMKLDPSSEENGNIVFTITNADDHDGASIKCSSPVEEYSTKAVEQKSSEEADVSYNNVSTSQLILEMSNPDLNFLRSLLPDMERMEAGEKSRFKLAILTTLNDMLYS